MELAGAARLQLAGAVGPASTSMELLAGSVQRVYYRIALDAAKEVCSVVTEGDPTDRGLCGSGVL